MKSTRKILTINHNIFLTKNQRYLLFNGNNVETIGVSLPVWVERNNQLQWNETSNFSNEIFVKYILTNNYEKNPIETLEEGYKINLPQPFMGTNISYDKIAKKLSSKNLLDLRDGGGSYLFFIESNMVKIHNDLIKIKHYVKIEDITSLEKTIAT